MPRLAFVASGCAVGLITSNPWLTTAGLAAVLVLVVLLWRAGEPPALLFAAGFQWLQVFTPVVQADLQRQSLTDPLLWHRQFAAWLGLGVVLVLAAGMRVGAGSRATPRIEAIDHWARQILWRPLAVAYLSTFAMAAGLDLVAVQVPSLRQGFQAVSASRWVLVFLVLWIASLNSRFRTLALGVVVIETVVGFGGYFSGFKFVLFLSIVALFVERHHRFPLFRPSVAIAGATLLGLTVFWQAVKEDYRSYLNQGTNSQATLVSRQERYSYLAQSAAKVEGNDLLAGLSRGIDRVGYLEYLAQVVAVVPTAVPYQNGRLWGEALQHVLMPRLLFPDKAVVNDSLRTAEFTLSPWLARASGTSISLGYAAESYIDFGPVLMFVPVFGLGWFWGRGYRWLAGRCVLHPLGVSAAIIFIMSLAALFEASNVKLIGGALTALIVWTLELRLFGSPTWRFLTGAVARPGTGGTRAWPARPYLPRVSGRPPLS